MFLLLSLMWDNKGQCSTLKYSFLAAEFSALHLNFSSTIFHRGQMLISPFNNHRLALHTNTKLCPFLLDDTLDLWGCRKGFFTAENVEQYVMYFSWGFDTAEHFVLLIFACMWRNVTFEAAYRRLFCVRGFVVTHYSLSWMTADVLLQAQLEEGRTLSPRPVALVIKLR